MSLGAALVASFLVTLARPETWVLALASFLARGGILVVLAPIVIIPSAAGIADVFAPTITSFVFGGWSPLIVLVLVGTVGFTMLWLLAAGLLAAAVEGELIRIVASDEDVVATDRAAPRGGGHTLDILAVRLLALVPVATAMAWGSTRIVAVAYGELTLPSSTAIPVTVRVVQGASEAIAVIALAWLFAGVLGSVAARAVILGERRPAAALWAALRWMVRHPLRALVLELVPLIGLILVIVPSVAAAATTWDAVRGVLVTGGSPVLDIGLVLLFIGLWLGGLALVAVASAWRAAAWTVGLAGTFGASTSRRPGDWTTPADSATLADLRPRGVDPDAR